MKGAPRLTLELLRFALWAYPRDFRRRFGPEIEDAFADGWLDKASQGRASAARFLVRTLFSVVATGFAERAHPFRTSTDSTPRYQPMDILRQDLRYAVRGLLRRPGFASIVILTLGLGVGANTAIFSLVNGVLLTPLPYEDADRLVTVWRTNEAAPDARRNMSAQDVQDLETAVVIESLVAYSDESSALTGFGNAEVVEGTKTIGSLLEVFGLAPQLGRDLGREDSYEGAAAVVVVSHAFWQDRLGATPSVLGRTLELDGEVFEIVGVAPLGFDFPSAARFWRPYALDPEGCGRGCHVFRAIGRLAPDATVESARPEIEAVARNLQETFADTNRDKLFSLVPLLDVVVGDVRAGLFILLGAVGLVLLIACANVANLLLVRAQSRSAEIAVRTALGASGRRLAAQVIIESLVLSLAGGAAGLFMAWVGVKALRSVASASLPRLDEVAIDGTVLVFTLVLVITVALAFGVAPAVRSARTAPALSLGNASQRGGGRRTARLRSLLLTGEVALSLVLLVGTGLLLRSFAELMAVPLGYETENVVRFSLSLPENQYPDRDAIAGFFDRLEERIRTTPGVEAVGSILGAPLGTTSVGGNIEIVGQPDEQGSERGVRLNTVTAGYHETVGIRILQGRGLLPTDGTDAVPVALVSQSLVEQNFPGEDPLGRQFIMSMSFGYGKPTFTIVGVVADVVSSSLTGSGGSAVYVPIAQMGPGFATVHVRTRQGALAVLPTLRGLVRELDPNLPLWDVERMGDVVQSELAPTRLYLTLIGLFAGLAVMLAAVGLYGVVAYLVSRRTREIGVRVALGARRSSIVGLVFMEAMRPAVLGVGVGLLGAWAGAQALERLLFQVAPTDLRVFAGVPVLLLLVVAIAALIPARHAALIEPVEALRNE